MHEDDTIILDGIEYKPTFTPNWIQFSKILESAKGPHRSMGAFADVCSISPATFTRIVKGHYKKALKQNMLEKIYENADPQAAVTMDELLRANGYRAEGEEDDSSKGSIRVADLYGIISKELYTRGLAFMTYPSSVDGEVIPESKLGMTAFDKYQAPWTVVFHIQGISPQYLKFHGNLMNEDFIDSKENLWRALKPYNMLFLRDQWEPEATTNYSYTIVFKKEEAFHIFVDAMKDVKVNNYISAILIDDQKQTVENEFAIPRKKGNTLSVFKG